MRKNFFTELVNHGGILASTYQVIAIFAQVIFSLSFDTLVLCQDLFQAFAQKDFDNISS